jgi:hypothetical protein
LRHAAEREGPALKFVANDSDCDRVRVGARAGPCGCLKTVLAPARRGIRFETARGGVEGRSDDYGGLSPSATLIRRGCSMVASGDVAYVFDTLWVINFSR